MKNKFFFIALALIVVASMLLTACQPKATEAPAPAEEEAPAEEAPAEEAPAEEAPAEEVVVEEEAEPSKLVYIDNTGFYTLDIFLTPWFSLTQALMYDSLVVPNLELNGYIGGIAESWEVAEDDLSVTFTLRQDVLFHDGTVCDANALKWNYDKYLDPEWPKEINDTWANFIESFEVIDDYTLRINLIQPYAALYADLYLTYIVSPTAYEALGADGFGRAPVGTGPFMPVEIVENSYVLYERNPDYVWAPSYASGEPPKLDQVEIRFITDEAVTYAQLETGEASVALVPSQYIEAAQANPDLVVTQGIDWTTRYLGWNFTKPIYQDIEFRQAITHAIDRESVLLAGYGGAAFENASFFPASTWGYQEEMNDYAKSVFTYDPAVSIELLDGLGYLDSDGDGVREANGEPIMLPFAYAPSEDIQRIAETIQAQLAEVGIGVELTPMESAAQAEMLVACQQDLFIRQYGLNDATIVNSMVTPPNRNCWDDAQAQALGVEMDTTMDEAARKAVALELNTYMVDQYAWVPLYSPLSYVATRAELKGLLFDKIGGVYLFDAYFED